MLRRLDPLGKGIGQSVARCRKHAALGDEACHKRRYHVEA
jgi:hypothetical protein